jgi:pimeloyl-ACP methyl ester carboxylesterase
MTPTQAHSVTGGGGLALHMVETGNAAGRPILFIHGFSQCRLSWIATMRKPMLLTYGERDAIVLPAMGRHLAQVAPHALLSLYEGTGHSPFWEAPDRFNRELRHFAGSLPAARTAAAR